MGKVIHAIVDNYATHKHPRSAWALRRGPSKFPALVRQAKESDVPHYIGRGLSRWSNVHIADVAALYVLAAAKAPQGP